MYVTLNNDTSAKIAKFNRSYYDEELKNGRTIQHDDVWTYGKSHIIMRFEFGEWE